MWNALIILGEDDWEIQLTLSSHSSKDLAEQAAKSDGTSPMFVMLLDTPAIQLQVKDKLCCYFDDDVVIKEVSLEKRNQMGPPLDTRNQKAAEIAIQAIMTQDPAYSIYPQDMVLSNRRLANFLDRYGAGYRIDVLAWGITSDRD